MGARGQIFASRHLASPAVLWVDDIVPEPDHDSGGWAYVAVLASTWAVHQLKVVWLALPGSIRNINIMKMLLSEGYALSFQPTAARAPKYKAVVRSMGVHVMPVAPPHTWELSDKTGCLFDVIFVARRGVFEKAAEAIELHCPHTPIIYDTGELVCRGLGAGAELAARRTLVTPSRAWLAVDLHFLREARDALTSAPAANATWNFDSVTIPSIIEWLDSGEWVARWPTARMPAAVCRCCSPQLPLSMPGRRACRCQRA